MEWLPDAIRDPHGGVLAFTRTDAPKGCLHTTETSSWPTYQGWSIPPHLTVHPTAGIGVTVRQHIPLDRASFALEHRIGTAETNRDDVIQVELVGTCDPSQRGRLYFWPDADDVVLADLFRKVIGPASRAAGIPVSSTVLWLPYPGSYGSTPARLGGRAWLAYSGWLGHQHAAGNSHGDPGAFPWDRMIQLSAPAPAKDDPMAGFSIDDIGKAAAKHTMSAVSDYRPHDPTEADPDRTIAPVEAIGETLRLARANAASLARIEAALAQVPGLLDGQ